VDPGLIEMGRTYGLSRWQLYRQVILPGALSSILVGLRFSLGLMWVILIVAETISAQSGIGYLTMNAREFLQTDVVLVGILLYALLGKLADLCSPAGWSGTGCSWHPWLPAPLKPYRTHTCMSSTSSSAGGVNPPDPGPGQALRRARGPAQHRAGDRAGRVRRAIVGPQRLRQEHAAAAGGRAGARPPAKAACASTAQDAGIGLRERHPHHVPGLAPAALAARCMDNVTLGLPGGAARGCCR
jgi:hypothetical protein